MAISTPLHVLVRTAVYALACAFVLLAGGADAQEAESPEEREYWTLIDEGIAEAEAGHHGEALVLFRRAHELRPSARTLRAQGLMLYELRDYVAAAQVLAEALADTRRPLEADDRAEAESALRRARNFIGTLELRLRPANARVAIDGRRVTVRADVVSVNPGDHEIAVEAAGYLPQTRSFSVRAGEQLALEIALVPPTPVGPPTIPVVVRSPQPELTLHAAPVVLGRRRMIVGRSEVCTAPCEHRLEPGHYELGISERTSRPVVVGQYHLRGPTRLTLHYTDREAWRIAGWITIPVTIAGSIAFAIAGGAPEPDNPVLLALSPLTAVAGLVLTFTWTFLRNAASVELQPLAGAAGQETAR